jgi:hypothetical protein
MTDDRACAACRRPEAQRLRHRHGPRCLVVALLRLGLRAESIPIAACFAVALSESTEKKEMVA